MEQKMPAPSPVWVDEFKEDWEPYGAPVIGYWLTLSDPERAQVTSLQLCELCHFLARTIPLADAWEEQGSSVAAEITWLCEHLGIPHPTRLLGWLDLGDDVPLALDEDALDAHLRESVLDEMDRAELDSVTSLDDIAFGV